MKEYPLILLTLLLAPSMSRALEESIVAVFEGVYLSSMQGGCALELHKDASFALTCLSQPHRKGRIQVLGNVMKIEPAGPIPVFDFRLRLIEPKGAHAPAGDPTSGPL